MAVGEGKVPDLLSRDRVAVTRFLSSFEMTREAGFHPAIPHPPRHFEQRTRPWRAT